MRCLVFFLKWTKISIEDKRFRLSLRGYMPSLPQRRHDLNQYEENSKLLLRDRYLLELQYLI